MIDLGSGAGLPGIPLAIASGDRKFVLVEPKRRAAAFLELAIEHLELGNVVVAPVRAQDLPLRAGVCVARAFGSLEKTWRVGSRLLNPSGRVIYYAGNSWNIASDRAMRTEGAVTTICAHPNHAWEGPIVTVSASHHGREE